MKKLLFTLVACLITLSLSANAAAETSIASNVDGIQQSTNTPSAVALKFCNSIKNGTFCLDLIYNKELEETYKNLNAEQRKIMKTFADVLCDEMQKSILEDFPELGKASFTVVSEKIAQDKKTAIVKMKLTYEGDVTTDEIPMIKVNGVWKVDVDKWD